jgi:hypothetical protein
LRTVEDDDVLDPHCHHGPEAHKALKATLRQSMKSIKCCDANSVYQLGLIEELELLV